MRKRFAIIPIIVWIVLVSVISSCTGYPYETNALETLTPIGYDEESLEDGAYLGAIEGLRINGPNPEVDEYPTTEHLMYIYVVNYFGSGNPAHSLLIDFVSNRVFYCIHLDLLRGNNWDFIESFELDESDIDRIRSFDSVKGITNWDSYYKLSHSEADWVVTLYFEDGTFFQSGGSRYPDEYKAFEREIWTFVSEKTGEEFWWM